MTDAALESQLRRCFALPDQGRCPELVRLARYAAGGLAGPEREAFEEHLRGCPECEEHLRVHRQTADLFLTEKTRERRPWPGRWPALAGLGAAMAAALLLFLPSRRPPSSGLRAKGGYELHVAAEHQGKRFRLEDGARLSSGDRLGFFYSAERPGYLLVLYADSAPQIVRLLPTRSGESMALSVGREQRIEDGAQLSEGSGCEWIVALFSDQPLRESAALEIARDMIAHRSACRLPPPSTTAVEAQVLTVIR